MTEVGGLCAYYTPEPLARLVARSIRVRRPRAVLDPAAGDGALLLATVARFPAIDALAIDIDRRAVGRIRQALPNCVASVCDALSPRSVSKSRVWGFRACVDVVVANPPFGSLSGPRLVTVPAWGEKVRCGVGAAHILSAILRFLPKQFVAVVPDSMLHSARDARARDLIASRYSFDLVQSLGNGYFGGAGASVSLVKLNRRRGVVTQSATKSAVEAEGKGVESVLLTRGGLPMHDAEEVSSGGVPLMHTTNLGDSRQLKLVKPLPRGVVSGPLILLPRVGLPAPRHLVVTKLGADHQLSDCVVALSCSTNRIASDVSRKLKENFDALRACWGGTGAQYTTLDKLRDYLTNLGITVKVGCVDDSRATESEWPRMVNGNGGTTDGSLVDG